MHSRIERFALPKARHDATQFQQQLNELAQKETELSHDLERVAAGSASELRDRADLASACAALANRQIAILGQWLLTLDQHLNRVEKRLDELASQCSEHGAAIHMVCQILKDLDDPYGFGERMDEQIASEQPEPDSGRG